MSAFFGSYMPLLLVTLALECGYVWLVAPRERRPEVVLVCVAANLMSHPTATALSWYRLADVFSLELAALLFEWLVYSRLLGIGLLPALRYAFYANLISALAGVALWAAKIY